MIQQITYLFDQTPQNSEIHKHSAGFLWASHDSKFG
jgi:hypothetical protein